MTGFGSSRKNIALTVLTVSMVGLPLLARAQGTPKPTPPGAQGTSATLPTPVAAKGTTKPPAPAAAPARAPGMPTLTDSARAAIREQTDREVKQMAETLKLSPEQRTKVRSILTEHAYRVMQMRDKYPPQGRTPATAEAMKKEMQALRDSTDARLAQVLTADQMAGFKKWRDAGLMRMRSKVSMPADTTTKK